VARWVVEGFLHGLHRSPYVGFSVDFASHREYIPGDDLRHLNWKLFGRQDRLYIKQYDAETNVDLHLVVEGDPQVVDLAGRIWSVDCGHALVAKRTPTNLLCGD